MVDLDYPNDRDHGDHGLSQEHWNWGGDIVMGYQSIAKYKIANTHSHSFIPMGHLALSA